MIRVLDEQRSVEFYARAFGMKVSRRLDKDSFTLVYLRGEETDAELELTVNKGRHEGYSHGDGYGHVAFVVGEVFFRHGSRRIQDRGAATARPLPINK
jgi:lactoylglutathione lyase